MATGSAADPRRAASPADRPIGRLLLVIIVAPLAVGLVYGGLEAGHRHRVAAVAAGAAALAVLLAEVLIARSVLASVRRLAAESRPRPADLVPVPAPVPEPAARVEPARPGDAQARLRASFDEMLVNLARRSQSLTERLARMLETQAQGEDDPDRYAGLTAMDHLVTRMRRGGENLLLLAGHENPRQWSGPVPLADVAHTAITQVEQYDRVTLSIPADLLVIGPAVPDVVRLLAELIENATLFSPKETAVHVSLQELASGGVLLEIADQGIGVSETRLAEMNWRLDNPPPLDVSVSRHMGLFAVARLAQRHRVRVRLRPRSPRGVSALIWLPDTALRRGELVDAGAPAPLADEPAPRYSPERARDRLSGFQRGARRAESQGGQRGVGGYPPQPGEGH